jgi:GNAT superfamily N-acetyltransferase
MTLVVRPFEARDLAPIATLLARAHQRDRAIRPELPSACENPDACEGAIRESVLDRDGDLAVAERDGRIVGYLGGARALHAPDSFGAQYSPPHSISVPLAGHALAEGEPASETYRALYAPLADRWASDGFFTHHVSVRAEDLAVREAWFLLGFGAHSTFAVRSTAPLGAPPRADLEVHAASIEELPVVRHLDELESLFHRQSPIFWPHLGRDVSRAVETFQRAALEGTVNPVFLGTRDGEPLAMHFVIRSGGFGGRLSSPGDAAYLYQGIVEPEARGSGIGTALLSHTLDWARDQGADWITLHYATMNPSGAPFWEHHGFRPLEMSLERRLDERIAWASAR